MADEILKVGIGSRNYGYYRASYGLPVPNASFSKGVYIPWRRLGNSPRLENTYYFLPLPKFDLFHLWNGVLLNRHPFVTSFESYLPREFDGARDRAYWRALERLASPDCRRILALSDFARQFMQWQNREVLDDSILKKVEVFYGAVEIPAPSIHRVERADGSAFRCCFIGHDFFRKGGAPTLRAFERLAARYPQLRLVVVSKLMAEDYVTHEPQSRADEVREKVRNMPWVEWHESLPHVQVLDLIRSCDIGILPTLDDTFGWSVLEAMSHGLPVISTDICALPESVIDGHNGFHIRLDKAVNRRWAGYGLNKGSVEFRLALDKAYQEIEDSLVALLSDLCENPAQLERLGANAIQHVRDRHDPGTLGRRLGDIYREAAC